MTYYKLTDTNGDTYNGMHWAEGITNVATGDGEELCTDGFLHVYDTPEQAVFMRSAHVPDYTRLWEVESDDEGITDDTKRGIKRCAVLREIELPDLTVEQIVEIAIRVSLLIYKGKSYVEWAEDWLSGGNRSDHAAADAVAHAAFYAAADAAYAADAADMVDAVVHATDCVRPIDLIGIIKQVLAGKQ